MTEAIPVILCGQTIQIGTGVVALLKPEYEGIPRVLPLHTNLEERRKPKLIQPPHLKSSTSS